MKIAVTGQGILAETTRTCCAKWHDVVNHTDKDIEVLWVCYDTPLENGEPDYEWVVNRLQRELSELPGRPVILISSQMPVLTTFRLEQRFPGHFFAYSPENIRVATPIDDFEAQARIVVGVRSKARNSAIWALLKPFANQSVIFTSPETAEMVKHALNSYLGMSIAFINEIARVCESVKADANVVSEALLSERRISPNAPLKPGKPFGGGHLIRDIRALEDFAKGRGIRLPIISHIRESNEG